VCWERGKGERNTVREGILFQEHVSTDRDRAQDGTKTEEVLMVWVR
jgi:hypothetical protein